VLQKSMERMTFSVTESDGRNWKNWKTIPTFLPHHTRDIALFSPEEMAKHSETLLLKIMS